MAKKNLSNKQRRFLFAKGILRKSGKGKSAKVVYKKGGKKKATVYKSKSLQALFEKGVISAPKPKTKVTKLEGELKKLEQKRINRIKTGRNRGGSSGSFNYDINSINFDIKKVKKQIEIVKNKNN